MSRDHNSDENLIAHARGIQNGDYPKEIARLKAQIDEKAGAALALIPGYEAHDDADTDDGIGADSWPDPAPVMVSRRLPVFPVDALTDWVAAFARSLAEATQTPVDMPAVLVLSCTAAAAGGRAVVEVRPGWREPLNLYTVVAMPPGSRKSAVFAACTEPLVSTEQSMAMAASVEIVEAQTRKAVAQAAAQKAAMRAANSDGDEQASLLSAAGDAALMAEAITVPVRPRLVADDATPEAIGSLLAEQGGRLAVMSPEGDVFEIMRGRYSAAPNISMFLKAHAGDLLKIDRKGRPPEYVARPALTIASTIQPAVVESMARHDGFRGRGLLARFLWAMPPSNMGTRRINPASVPEAVHAAYTDNLQLLVASLAEWTDPAVLVLTPEAHDLVVELETQLEPRLGPGGDLAHIADWAGKYAGAVVRIAGLLHLSGSLRTGWGEPITADTMRRARRIGGYFLDHAVAAFDVMGANPERIAAAKVLAWAHGMERFSRRDVHRAHQADFAKAADVDPVLDLLIDLGWIRRDPDPPRSKRGGRTPAPTYTVHPNHR